MHSLLLRLFVDLVQRSTGVPLNLLVLVLEQLSDSGNGGLCVGANPTESEGSRPSNVSFLLCLSNLVSEGTAVFPLRGPIFPSAQAAASRTSPSCFLVTPKGGDCRLCFGPESSHARGSRPTNLVASSCPPIFVLQQFGKGWDCRLRFGTDFPQNLGRYPRTCQSSSLSNSVRRERRPAPIFSPSPVGCVPADPLDPCP